MVWPHTRLSTLLIFDWQPLLIGGWVGVVAFDVRATVVRHGGGRIFGPVSIKGRGECQMKK
jgi:hypothetical protein